MFGSRRRAVQFGMARSRASRLMQVLPLAATDPKRNTTFPNHEDKKFPHLLRNVIPLYPNHRWSTDITRHHIHRFGPRICVSYGDHRRKDGRRQFADGSVFSAICCLTTAISRTAAKYECAHVYGLETMPELHRGLERLMNWYTSERIHSSLSYNIPRAVDAGDVVLADLRVPTGRRQVF